MQESLFNKVAGLIKKFIKKRRLHRCIPVNFAKFLRTPFLQNNSDNCFWKMLDEFEDRDLWASKEGILRASNLILLSGLFQGFSSVSGKFM